MSKLNGTVSENKATKWGGGQGRFEGFLAFFRRFSGHFLGRFYGGGIYWDFFVLVGEITARVDKIGNLERRRGCAAPHKILLIRNSILIFFRKNAQNRYFLKFFYKLAPVLT